MGVLYLATSESLDDMLAAAQALPTDDTTEMAKILARFEGLALSISRSLTSNWSLQQDAAQGARIALVKAVRSHTIGTPGFPAYAKRYMKGAALRTLMAMRGDELSLDPVNYEWIDKPPRDTADSMAVEFDDLLAVLEPEQREIVTAYYVTDRTMGEIAASLGVSKPAVSQRMSTIYRALRPIVEGALAA